MNLAQTIQTNGYAALLGAVPPIEALPRPSLVSVSFRQQRLCFLSRLGGGSEVRHRQIGLQLRGELDQAILQSALDGLAGRDEVLRTTVGVEDGQPFQRVGPADAGLPLKRDDLGAADAEARIAALMLYEQQAAFGLDAWRLIRTRLGLLADDRPRKIVTRELYAAAREGRADRLTSLPVHYAAYSLRQQGWLVGEVLKRQFWRMLVGMQTVLKLPTDRPCPGQQDSGSYVEFISQEPPTAQLNRDHGTTLVHESAGGLVARAGALGGSRRAGDRNPERQPQAHRDCTADRSLRQPPGAADQSVVQSNAGDLAGARVRPLLLAEERHRVLVAPMMKAAHPQDRCIQEPFEAQEERDPEGIASGCEYQVLSYRELNCGRSRPPPFCQPQASPTNSDPGSWS
ncbi:condensation domain-containing protein [Mesorhizobium sp. WSM1293]|uniref:condensation domain-containing protein n=1 Tax=Mesorhizobium sp. WSM1293 TaxID=1040984 RepID=UPI0004858EBB|nr:condensation domain-containing protein [Mesorhizobium sp. WSM1293]